MLASGMQAALVPVWTGGETISDDLGGAFAAYTSPGCKVDLELTPASDSWPGALEIRYSNHFAGSCGVFFHLFDETASLNARRYADIGRYSWLHLIVRGDLDAQVRIADPTLYAKEDSIAVGSLREIAADASSKIAIPLKQLRLRTPLAAVLAFSFRNGASGTLVLRQIAFSEEAHPVPESREVKNQSVPLRRQLSRAMWFWEFGDCIEDAALCDRVLNFAKERGIETVYAQIRYTCSDGNACEIDRPTRVREILKRAHDLEIRVEALDGAPEYALARFHPRMKSLVRAILGFNGEGADAERFTGVHFDIEPYLLLGFAGGVREKILREYLTLNRDVAELVRAEAPHGFTFGADIPFWYDEAQVNGVNPYEVLFNGARQNVTRHLIDMLDSVTLMDYRNSALGTDGIIAHGSGEIDYASQRGKKVFIGVETLPQRASETVFLAGLSEARWSQMREEPILFERAFEGYRLIGLAGNGEHYIGLEPTGAMDERFLRALEHLAGRLGLGRMNSTEAASRREGARVAIGRSGEYSGFRAVPLDGRCAFAVQSSPLEKLSFYGKSVAGMNRILRSVEDHFSPSSAFGGIAIHSYESYREMR